MTGLNSQGPAHTLGQHRQQVKLVERFECQKRREQVGYRRHPGGGAQGQNHLHAVGGRHIRKVAACIEDHLFWYDVASGRGLPPAFGRWRCRHNRTRSMLGCRIPINYASSKPSRQVRTHIRDSEGQRHSLSPGRGLLLRDLILNVTFPVRVPLDLSSSSPWLRFGGTGSR